MPVTPGDNSSADEKSDSIPDSGRYFQSFAESGAGLQSLSNKRTHEQSPLLSSSESIMKNTELDRLDDMAPAEQTISIQSEIFSQGRPSDSVAFREKATKSASRPPCCSPSSSTIPVYHRIQGLLSDAEFKETVESVKEAIKHGIHPIRIRQGSSGSYFARNKLGKIVGVFKPKNEEPYGQLNPKWTKWLHKTCFPCFFGRGCLIPNLGYISEAAASVLDRRIGLNIVPRTDVVELSSAAFHYSWLDQRQSSKKGLPGKIGSFQIFLFGYRDASISVKDFLNKSMPSLKEEFQQCFERLVILDYLMRNTDRGMDNWMIYFGRPEENEPGCDVTAPSSDPWSNQISPSPSPETRDPIAKSSSLSSWHVVSPPIVRIAGIDNGLAFPFKHPDQWRSYPFGWSWLPFAKAPFSSATREIFLPRLSDPKFRDDLVHDIRRVFMMDEDYDDKLFQKQMALMRGQLHNLVEALTQGLSPYELVAKPLLMIYEDEELFSPDASEQPSEFQERLRKRWKKIMIHVKPCFSWC